MLLEPEGLPFPSSLQVTSVETGAAVWEEHLRVCGQPTSLKTTVAFHFHLSFQDFWLQQPAYGTVSTHQQVHFPQAEPALWLVWILLQTSSLFVCHWTGKMFMAWVSHAAEKALQYLPAAIILYPFRALQPICGPLRWGCPASGLQMPGLHSCCVCNSLWLCVRTSLGLGFSPDKSESPVPPGSSMLFLLVLNEPELHQLSCDAPSPLCNSECSSISRDSPCIGLFCFRWVEQGLFKIIINLARALLSTFIDPRIRIVNSSDKI